MPSCDYCSATFELHVGGYKHDGEYICDDCNDAAAVVRRADR